MTSIHSFDYPARYALHRWRRRKLVELTGTQLQQINQLTETVRPYLRSVFSQDEQGRWQILAVKLNGDPVLLVNTTRLACLIDLATILEFKFS